MQLFNLVALVLVVGKPRFFASASWENIAGYAPGSQVTSHNAIDLDQKALENILGVTPIQYANVKNVYENGGNSKTYAEFSVNALSSAVGKGDAVAGATSGITGKMYSSYSAGATSIKVAYATADAQSTYVGCKGGALQNPPTGTTATAMTPYVLTSGCFQNEQLTVTTSSGNVVGVTPTGVPTTKAGRTLKGFSTKAGDTMYNKGTNGGCKGASDRATDGCPYKDFSEYYNYYGDFNYADKFVLAAINGGSTSFTKSAGDMDFTGTADVLRKECIKKGTAYMNAWMYAIREFEDAIDDCKVGCPSGQSDTVSGKDCNSLSVASVHAWDEGVRLLHGLTRGRERGRELRRQTVLQAGGEALREFQDLRRDRRLDIGHVLRQYGDLSAAGYWQEQVAHRQMRRNAASLAEDSFAHVHPADPGHLALCVQARVRVWIR
jgi:hypothetical protein